MASNPHNFSFRRQSNFKEKSKENLSTVLKKKIQTTMIGSISSVEEFFGFLWDGETEEHQQMYDLFQQLRSDILDKGNHQARNIDAELAQYEVEWLKHTTVLPVLRRNETGGEDHGKNY